MNPHLNEVIRLLDDLGLGNEETLEDVGEVTHVELVVEVGGSLSEVLLDLTMEGQSGLNDGDDLLLDGTLELGEVLAHEGVIDGEQRGLLRERNCKGPEVTLKARVDMERTGGGVHASSVQSVLDVLQGKLGAIIPVLVVLVLSQERDGSLGVVGIEGRHVQIIDKVDQLVLADWGISATGLLLELLLEHILQKHGVSVEVKVHNLHDVLVCGGSELV